MIAILMLFLQSVVPPGQTGVRLQAEADRAVYLPGDTIRVELSAYITAPSSADALRTGRGLDNVAAHATEGPVRRLSDGRSQSRDGHAIMDQMVYRYARTILYAALAPGTVTLGPWQLETEHGPVVATALPLRIADPPSFQASVTRAVLPLRADVFHPGGGIAYRRNGYASVVNGMTLLTSWHLVRGADRIEVTLPSGRTLPVRKGWSAQAEIDAALLYIDAAAVADEQISPLSMAADHTVAPGDWVYAVTGNRISSGWLHVVPDQADSRRWLATNRIRPGDSGSPLLTREGNIVGVVAAGMAGVQHPDVLREDLMLAYDPRPLFEPVMSGASPRSIDDLNQPENLYNRIMDVEMALATRTQGRSSDTGTLLLEQLLLLLEEAESAPIPDAELLHRLGLLAQHAGDRELARQAYLAALNADPQHYGANYLIGLLHVTEQDWSSADTHFTRVASGGPFRHLATYGMARSAMGLHQFDRAESLLNQVLASDPGFAPALFDLGQVQLAKGNRLGAKQITSALYRLDSYWARRLTRSIEHPEFGPSALSELPRLTLDDL